MLSRIKQTAHLDVPIVSADDVKRAEDDREIDSAQKPILKQCDDRRVRPPRAHRSVDSKPRRKIDNQKQKRRHPFLDGHPRRRLLGRRRWKIGGCSGSRVGCRILISCTRHACLYNLGLCCRTTLIGLLLESRFARVLRIANVGFYRICFQRFSTLAFLLFTSSSDCTTTGS